MSNWKSILFYVALLPATLAGGEAEPRPFDLADEVVCRVNTEAISKKQVEERMEEIAIRLYAWRKSQEEAGQWTIDAEKKFNELYIPPFRDALRRVVRERLMLQYAKIEKTHIDERSYEKQVRQMVDQLKQQGLMGGKGYTMGEVQKRIRERMILDNFRYQFANFLDYPTRPEVKKHYEQNLSRYERKAGVMVRLIRIDRFVTNKLTGKQTANPEAYDQALRLREDIVALQGNFEEIARRHNDDEDLKSRGGLIVLNPKDPYFDPEGYNPQLAKAIRNLQPGEVSKVFELGNSSWAFAQLVQRREAGPAPLEGELYEEIYKTIYQQKTRKKEDDWFRKALSKSLVVHVVEGNPKTLPIEFFFPDDVKPAEPAAAPKKDAVTSDSSK
ncbi:MAG TPA: peptidyl-prolyl cis-trans isomerase [Planctomycetota bacterium]|nr:peptidyl-prolyl cis-trans isomerase [Planctomycetota bacterium]